MSTGELAVAHDVLDRPGAILAYAIFHVLHMALGVGNPDSYQPHPRPELRAHRGLPAAISLAALVALVALGLHLCILQQAKVV